MLNEAETRAEHIDPALKAAGWGVVEGSKIRREYYISPGRLEGGGKRGKPEKADYVLEFRGRKLAIIEAKKWDSPHTEGVGQAKSGAAKLALRYAYSTNGQTIYCINMDDGAEGDVPNFPSPDELWKLTNDTDNPLRDRLAAIPFEHKGGAWASRYYQDIAIDRVLDAIANGKKRVLLTLATGTGKTLISFQVAWKLFQSRWNLSSDGERRPRILFLADRNILANQAFNAFSGFPEDAMVRIDPEEIRKKGRVPKNGSIFFAIFQTLMTAATKDGLSTPYFKQYAPDFFDFIVIDECHRGGAEDESTWRSILEYFAPAVQLGLTATPRRQENADTYTYFGEPVYVYSLKQGIEDGFLTPFRVKQITTTLDEYVYSAEDEVIDGELEEGQRLDEDDLNRVAEIRQREEYRVKLFMDLMDQREKTLVFCATQEHALAVRDLVNKMKTNKDPHYCVRVTARDGKRGDEYLREFQDNEKYIPTVLTTSRKLSTGVDARNVRNIVLMRPIKSIVEFKQIIGRGTRLYDDKDYFTIYDFVKAHRHFQDANWDGQPLQPDENETGSGPTEKPRDPDTASIDASSPPKKVKIKLAEGKELNIRHTIDTTYWSADGKQLSAQQFVEMFFGKLPGVFESQEELRTQWSDPETRAQLVRRLAEADLGQTQLAHMQKLLEAENSDIFDVLAHLAYGLPLLSRAQRAAKAQREIGNRWSGKKQAFLEFVLAQYAKVGAEELALENLRPLLRLRYGNAIADATAELGPPDQIRSLFVEFQKYLYQADEV